VRVFVILFVCFVFVWLFAYLCLCVLLFFCHFGAQFRASVTFRVTFLCFVAFRVILGPHCDTWGSILTPLVHIWLHFDTLGTHLLFFCYLGTLGLHFGILGPRLGTLGIHFGVFLRLWGGTLDPF